MNNNAVFWMNLNNINSNNNSATRSNKGSTDLFDNVLKSVNKQSKVTLNKMEKIIPTNKFNDKDIILDNDNKSIDKDTDHHSEQQDTIQSSYENINQVSDKKQDIKETTESKESDSETDTDKDIVQNVEEVKQSISTLNEILQALLNLSQELVPDNNKDIQYVASNINSAELSSKIEEISLQLEKLINNLSNTSQSQSLDLLKGLQEIQETLKLISKKSTVIEKDYIPELRHKFNELLASIQKLENPLSDLSIKISQKIQEKTETNENSKSPLLSKDTETLNVNLENDNSKVNSIETKTNLNSNNNNSQMQKPMQDILIDTSIKNNNNVIGEFNSIDTKVDNIQKYISLNKDSIFEQVVDKIKVNFTKNIDEIKIKLKPEILGEMTIKIIVEKGIVTAKAIVENYQIKQLLESNTDQLKESFKSEGLNFQALDVSVRKDSGFDRNSAKPWTSRNRIKNKKITLNDSNIGSLYEEVNNHNASIMNMYSTSLDIIV